MKDTKKLIAGSGKGGGGTGRVAREDPDTLRSIQYAKVLDLISEGEIEGLVDGLRSVYLDDVPMRGKTGKPNFQGVTLQHVTGTQSQEVLEGFDTVDNINPVGGTEIKFGTPLTDSITETNVDKAKVTLTFPRLTKQNLKNGDLHGYFTKFKIEYQPDGGSYINVRPVAKFVTNEAQYVFTPQAHATQVVMQETLESTSIEADIVWVRPQYGTTGVITDYNDYTGGTWSSVPAYGNHNITVLVEYKLISSGTWLTLGTYTLRATANDATEQEIFKTVGISGLVTGLYEMRATMQGQDTSEGANSLKWENPNSYSRTNQVTIKGKCTSPYSASYTFPLTGTGPWTIRVTKTVADDVDSSTNRQITWTSTTAIVDNKLNYPNSALVGLSVDSSQFQTIPKRGYDVRLIKVRLPDATHYDPITRVYTGTWDGLLTNTAWTDNPAWCFLDLLTNERYGLGQHLTDDNIDLWQIYKLAKYCDELVPSGIGDGVEPRLTLNVYMQTQEEAYSVLQQLSSAFRGMIYWANNKLMVEYDHLDTPSALFNNSNVQGGQFVYSGTSNLSRHNVVQVSWNDPKLNYRPRVEYVEDAEDISIRGAIYKKDIGAVGTTSRGQAHRMGRWILYAERYETEVVNFKCSLDNIGCAPGDIIDVYDKYRAGVRYGGRILSWNDINYTNLGEDLDEGAWLAYGDTTIEGDAIVDPNGELTAERINFPSPNGQTNYYDKTVGAFVATGQIGVFSCFIKDENIGKANLGVYTLGATPHLAAHLEFTFATETISNESSDIINSYYEDHGNGWYRIVISFKNSTIYLTSPPEWHLYVAAPLTTTETGDLGAWGFMIEEYIPDTEEMNPNVNFPSWTGDNPDGYTISAEDANNYITEHADGARIVSDGSAAVALILTTPNLVAGNTYILEFRISQDRIEPGLPRMIITNSDMSDIRTYIINDVHNLGRYRIAFTPTSSVSHVYYYRDVSTTTDYVIEYMSVKEANPPYLASPYAKKRSITIDEPITLTEGIAYSVSIIDSNPITETLPDGSIVETKKPRISEFSLQNEKSASVDQLQITTNTIHPDDVPKPNSLWAIFKSDVQPQQFKVLSIVEESRNVFEITAVQYNPSKYDYVENFGTLDVVETYVKDPLLDYVSNIVISEELYVGSEAVKNKLIIDWDVQDQSNILKYRVEIRKDDGLWRDVGTTNVQNIEVLDVVPGLYEVRIMVIDALNRESAAVQTDVATEIFGKTLPPEDVLNFQLAIRKTDVLLTWDAVADLDLSGYEIRKGTAWDTPDSILVVNHKSTSFIIDETTAGIHDYMIKAIDTSENYSVNEATQTFTLTIPEAPSTSSDVSGRLAIVSWTTVAGTYDISHYEIKESTQGWENAKLLDATTYSESMTWVSKIFDVRAVDVSGNEGSHSTESLTNLKPTNVSNLQIQVAENSLDITWDSIPDPDLDFYRIKIGSTWDTADLLSETKSTAIVKAGNFGDLTIMVRAVDIAGQESALEDTETLTVLNPGTPTITVGYNGPDIILEWDDVSTTFDIDYYELRDGSDTLILKSDATNYTETVRWSSKTYKLQAFDTYGNEGIQVTKTPVISAGTASGLTPQVIDNNVLLNWTLSPGTLPIAYTEVSSGVTAGTKPIGEKSGTFTVVFEPLGAQYTYWVVPVDTAGNAGTPATVTTTVNEPPDYILQSNNVSVFDDTFSNAVLSEGSVYMPVNTTETYEQHFNVNNSFASPNAQVSAGYPYWIEPTSGTGYYEEIIDIGAVVSGTKITVDIAGEAVDGVPVITPSISVSELGTVYGAVVNAYQTVQTNFQYVKVRIAVASSGGDDLYRLDSMTIRLDVKLRTDSGNDNITVASTGKTVNFNIDFLDVDSIVVSPNLDTAVGGGGTTQKVAIYDFEDVGNPTQFTVYLYNSSGTKTTGKFSWTARGI